MKFFIVSSVVDTQNYLNAKNAAFLTVCKPFDLSLPYVSDFCIINAHWMYWCKFVVVHCFLYSSCFSFALKFHKESGNLICSLLYILEAIEAENINPELYIFKCIYVFLHYKFKKSLKNF